MRYALIRTRQDGTEYVAEERDIEQLPTGGKVLRQQGTKLELQQQGVRQEQQGLRWEQQGWRELIDPDTGERITLPDVRQVPNMVDVPNMIEVEVPDYVEVDESAEVMVKRANGKPMLRPVVNEADEYRPRIHTRTITETIEPERVLRRYVSAPRALAAVRADLVARVKREARERLQDTDWFAIRAAETAAAIPAAVQTYRAAVRTAANAIETAIGALTLADLAGYDWQAEWPARVEA